MNGRQRNEIAKLYNFLQEQEELACGNGNSRAAKDFAGQIDGMQKVCAMLGYKFKQYRDSNGNIRYSMEKRMQGCMVADDFIPQNANGNATAGK